MKRAVLLLAAALAVGGCGSQAYSPSSAIASDYEDADLFYHDLAPYGQWVDVQSYGRCWRPHGVSSAWQPYTEGHWEYTEYGWTWVSDEPWGWAPYHYGRWFYEPAYGWLWVPGRQWAPAWVVWRRGGGWVGWAPAPPGWGPTIIERRTIIEPRHYCFIEERRFHHPRMRDVVTRRNPGLVNSTHDVTRYTVTDNHVANRSIEVEDIEQQAGRPIPRHKVAEFEQAAPRHVMLPRERGVQQQRPTAPPPQQPEWRGAKPQPQVEEKRDRDFGRPPADYSIFHRQPDVREQQRPVQSPGLVDPRRDQRRDVERREIERRQMERFEIERRAAGQRELERQENQRRETERSNAEQREAERRIEERRMPAPSANFERRPLLAPRPERAPVVEQRKEETRVLEHRGIEQQRRPEAPSLGVRAPSNVAEPAQSRPQPARPAENRQTGKPAVVSPESLRSSPPINRLMPSRP